MKFRGRVSSGPQQQWFSRNTQWVKWIEGNWNMMFMGVPDAPEENRPEKPDTTIDKVPIIREKTFITLTDKGFVVKMPVLKMNSGGPVNQSVRETTMK